MDERMNGTYADAEEAGWEGGEDNVINSRR
jgi:hypothetical protein